MDNKATIFQVVGFKIIVDDVELPDDAIITLTNCDLKLPYKEFKGGVVDLTSSDVNSWSINVQWENPVGD